MIWWCSGCGMEDTRLIEKCPSCGSALQTADLQWLDEEELGPETIFELELEPTERAAVVEALVSNRIRHRWDGDEELVISDENADAVDFILDEVLGEDTRDDDTDDDDADDEIYEGDYDDSAETYDGEFDDVAENGGYDVLSQLYLATDQLVTHHDDDTVKSFHEISGEILMAAPPFGIDEETWADVQSSARNVSRLLETDEDSTMLDSELIALRNQLKVLV